MYIPSNLHEDPQHELQEQHPHEEGPQHANHVSRDDDDDDSSEELSLYGGTVAANNLLSSGQTELFGREREVEQVLEAYKQCLLPCYETDHRAGCTPPKYNKCSSSILLITGVSGTGKTRLAQTLEPLVANDGGWFAQGKCDQIQNNATATLPYAPFVEAFDQFVNALMLARSPQSDNNDDNSHSPPSSSLDENASPCAIQSHLKEAIKIATKETSIHFLIEAIPCFKKLFAWELTDSEEAHNNTTTDMLGAGVSRNEADIPLHVILCKMLKTFCSPSHPMVLLIDDLQWIESNSLSLLKSLAGEHIPGFLLLGTCRGNEVSYQDSLSATLRTLEDTGVFINEIRLGNLTQSAIHHLITKTLTLSSDNDSQKLTDIVYQQTKGNAFFAWQFLRRLCETKVLLYDSSTDTWALSQERISKATQSKMECSVLCLSIIDSLIRRHTDKKEGFESAIESVLMTASCLGNIFSYIQIKAATPSLDNLVGGLEQVLQILLNKGVLVPTQHDAINGQRLSKSCFYRWSHDRFLQVAYSLIPEDSREEFHVSVGMNLLRRLPPLESASFPFVVVQQFSKLPNTEKISSLELFQTEKERFHLVALCLAAGERAAQSSAFDTALVYLRLGLQVVGSFDRAFEMDYELCLRLVNAAAEMECCQGNFDRVDELVAIVFEHSETLQDSLRACETQIYSLGSRQDLEGSISVGLRVLRQLGEAFPRHPGLPSAAFHLLTTKRRLANWSADKVLSLPLMRDWKKIAALRLINLIAPNANRCNTNLTVVLAARAIHLTLKYGLTEMASIGFGMFSMALCNPLGAIDDGIRVAEIASATQEAFDVKPLKARTTLVTWGFTKCYKLPLRESIGPLMSATQVGLLSGDIEMACLGMYCANCASFLTGAPLALMENEMAYLHHELAKRHQATILFYLRISQQVVQRLTERSTNTGSVLTGKFFDEKEGVNCDDAAGVTLIYLFQCFLAVYMDDPGLAMTASKKLKRRSPQAFNLSLLYQTYFIGALADILGARASGRKPHKAGKVELKKLRNYAKHAPENVLNKIYLIEAEQKVAKGRRKKALRLFQQSIDYAKDQSLVHEEALAHERCGLALLEWGDNAQACESLEKACALYEEWGSPVKVEQLSHTVARAGEGGCFTALE